MRKVLLFLFAGILFLGCKKDSGSNNNNNNNNNGGNTTTGTSTHSCGATNVHNPNKTYGSVTDIDGNTYKTIQIGSQTWMAEDLKVTKYRNGSTIQNITDNTQWKNNTTGAYCSYSNNTSNDCPYGKLYNWYAVNSNNGLCPTGWHVPTDVEWNNLINTLDPNANGGNNNNISGGKMKSTGTQYWLTPNTEATNSSGWSGLPGGSRSSDGSFNYIAKYATWWSSTENLTNGAWFRGLDYDIGDVLRDINNNKSGCSVRCIKD